MKRYLRKIKKAIYGIAGLNEVDRILIREYIFGESHSHNSVIELNLNSKPEVLNLNIIDSCNSKCTMCNIWKRDEALEIRPDQLGKILSDELFQELKHVGVTGGEPTLREDLPEIYKTIIQTLPNLKGLSIITNAIIETDVIKRISDVKNICDTHNIPFSAMISLDGVGKAHDNVRGTKGNFETAILVFSYLEQQLKIPTSFGCTISKLNVWDIDDLLFFAKENNMYGRFRVAETINRLYNHDRGKVIRNFDEDETYNLLLFFEKLKRTYETNSTYKRTYSSIQNILKGGKRLIGCPYHNKGVVLGSKGQLSYCAPKSKEIGNALESSASNLYADHFVEKKRIVMEDCSNCIHDYHAPITDRERDLEDREKLYTKYLKIENVNKVVSMSRWLKKVPKISKTTRIFILGWYGTETVGDKAILGGIVDYYQTQIKGNIEFVIGSLHPFVTKRTCIELNIEATVISTKTFDLLSYAKSSDLIVMGGGPLMDLNVLYVPLLGFKVAKTYRKKTVVFGCGLGPLKHEKFKKAVIAILGLTDEIKLRDKGSVEMARSLGIDKKIILSGDPAKGFVSNIGKQIVVERENILSCYLRDWTFEYYIGDKQDFIKDKEKFETGLALFIKTKANALQVERIEFHHMHNFVVGNDDRDFSRYFVKKFFQNDKRVFINKRLSTVESIVTSMKKSQFNICMRFHSVLFAHTLKSKFIGVDYTLGGKIQNYLIDNKAEYNMITVQQLIKSSLDEGCVS